jgi:hypothetical protein
MKYGTSFFRRLIVMPMFALLLGVGLLSLNGCDLFGSSDSAGEGRVRVLLIDNPFPFDLVAEANVTISHVELIGDDGRYAIMEEDREFNLLELRNGVSALLGEIDLPAGTYSQARLLVDTASVEMKDGRTFGLKVPSGSETGIKVLLHGLEIEEGMEATLTLDFDVSQSFVVQGNIDTTAGINGFTFKPVIVPTSITFEDADPIETDDGLQADADTTEVAES